MFPPTETAKPNPELEARLRESFGRLRERAPGDLGLAGQDPDPGGPEVREPSLPAKLFIGPNATWYDDRWRWMDWRGRRRSWNWAAASTFGAWFGYRRMYGWLPLFGASTLVTVSLGLLGTPLLIPLGLLLGLALFAGLFGNHLYLEHFRRAAGRIAERHEHHEAQVEAIVQAGGVDRRAAWLWPTMLLAAAGALAALIAVAGLGPSINL